MARKIKEIVVHSSDSPYGDYDVIDKWHKGNGWSMIGYHALVLNGRRKTSRKYEPEWDGKVQYGRKIDQIGSHVKGHNRFTYGICVIGEQGQYTPKQVFALLELVVNTCKTLGLGAENVKGHYEYDTAGDKTCPEIDMEWFRERVAERL